MKEFSEIPEPYRLLVIFITVGCFVFKRRDDHVKAKIFRTVETFCHLLTEGIVENYKSTNFRENPKSTECENCIVN